MGKFIQDTVDLRQIDDGIFATLSELEFISEKQEHNITVPFGFRTDGYSKPTILESLVGGRYEDDLRPAVLHDYLCQNKGYYYYKKRFIPLTFDEVNDLFYEAMRSEGVKKSKDNPNGISLLKAIVMRQAVNFNPGRW